MDKISIKLSLVILALVMLLSSTAKAQDDLQKGIDAVKKGDYVTAVNFLSNAVKAKQNYESFYYYGEALYRTGSIQQAEENLKKALKEDDEGIEALMSLGRIYSKQKKYDEADGLFKKGLKVEPENINLMIAQADNYSEAGKIDDAIKVLTLATTISKENPKVYVGLGDAYLIRGSYKLSLDYYKKALAINSNVPTAYFGIGSVYFRQRKYNEALVGFDNALLKDPKFAQAYLEKGKILYFGGKYGDAVLAFNEFTKLMPGSQEGNSYFAKTLYKQGEIYMGKGQTDQAKEKFDEALTILNDVLVKDPVSITGNLFTAYIYSARGDLNESGKEENYNKAIEYFKKVEIKNYEIEDLLKLGKLYVNLKNYSESYPIYEKAALKDSLDAEVYSEWGKAIFKNEKYEEAIPKFNRAIDLGDDDTYTELYKGLCLYALKKYDEAVPCFKNSIAIDQKLLISREFLARAYKFGGKAEDAVKAYEDVLLIDPENQEAKDAVKALKK
ncbi:MAG: tetratricopeptide repeat protein [Ignavibacteriae bacterium]|nr:tetratricopeptide repeat protein [Ignavibacteriota bacterium]